MKHISYLFLFLFTGFNLVAQTDPKALVENYQKLDHDEAVRCILIDKQNYKWLGTDKGLYKMISMDLDPEIIEKDSITGLAEDKRGKIWFGNRTQQVQTTDHIQNIILEQSKAEI